MTDAGASTPPGLVERTRCRPKFSEREIEILVEMTIDKFYASSRRLSASKKIRHWEEITAQVNAIAPCQRMPREVQKRWDDYIEELKEKILQGRRHTERTGFGPPIDHVLTPLEERASFGISEESLVGVVGGIDTGCDPPLTGALSPLERK
ncbi:myb-related transcription factor, partner of profilin-like [Mixophyes fleayi]|uniref:myb-related transcription factor, partner of profilin-like n=1 Tax=Mixophyes fleayi TaxID=3061075 RepID=UPI003F4DE2A5